jgi:hypothetical protein
MEWDGIFEKRPIPWDGLKNVYPMGRFFTSHSIPRGALVYSLSLMGLFFPVLLSLFRWTYSNYVTLVVCYRYAFLFAFINSSKPQSTHYSIYSCCFFSMYENMASGISFEINCLYTTTLYGTNRGEVKNEMTLKKKQW